MIESLKEMDKEIFLALNGSDSTFLNTIMDWASYKFTWIPLYILLLIYVVRQFRKRTILIVVVIAGMITAADQVSVLIKNRLVMRYRPCHNFELKDKIKMNGDCGGKFGFVSSHAANTFALAGFMFLLFRHRSKYLGIGMLSWAIFVSYSRIYNGAHFPLDIAGGALLGGIFAFLFMYFFRKLDMKFFEK